MEECYPKHTYYKRDASKSFNVMSESKTSTMSTVAAYDPKRWTCSSNEAVKIAIVGDEGAVQFHPQFTYPIFGDSEQIFGYNGLEINLAFNATTMLPLLGFKYKERLPDDSKVEDPQEKLVQFLPKDSLIVNDESRWAEQFEQELETFSPPGEIIASYTDSQGKEYEIYKATVGHKGAKEFHRRIQIFVLLFIEAGSYIDETDDRWEYFYIFEKKTTSNASPKFIGFTNVYSYWKYPGYEIYDKADTFHTLVRKKISQFVVLPPYQGQRHGAHLYNALVDCWLKDNTVTEIVVEDPSEAFDDLRDRCDLERLSKAGFFSKKNFPVVPVPEEELIEKQKVQKMEKRQFERVVEIGLLHLKSLENESKKIRKMDKEIRLQIKRRLYKKNKEALDGLEKAERLDKLQAAYERLVEDAERISEKVTYSDKRDLEESDDIIGGAVKKAKSVV